jgi:hypothetical protein
VCVWRGKYLILPRTWRKNISRTKVVDSICDLASFYFLIRAIWGLIC